MSQLANQDASYLHTRLSLPSRMSATQRGLGNFNFYMIPIQHGSFIQKWLQFGPFLEYKIIVNVLEKILSGNQFPVFQHQMWQLCDLNVLNELPSLGLALTLTEVSVASGTE